MRGPGQGDAKPEGREALPADVVSAPRQKGGHGHYTAWVLVAPLPSGRPEPRPTPPSATLLRCLRPCTPCPLCVQHVALGTRAQASTSQQWAESLPFSYEAKQCTPWKARPWGPDAPNAFFASQKMPEDLIRELLSRGLSGGACETFLKPTGAQHFSQEPQGDRLGPTCHQPALGSGLGISQFSHMPPLDLPYGDETPIALRCPPWGDS
ncbi:Rho Gtpase-Activating Protein 20 [Manis pentadactyla]|nr:Rho Gtpase-Activating Protein 20 [Manis pentadactyla]